MSKEKTEVSKEDIEFVRACVKDTGPGPADVIKAKDKALRYKQKEWYSISACLGVTWAWFYCLLGGREAGKSYSVTEFFVRQWKKYKIPFVWLRLNEASMKKMLFSARFSRSIHGRPSVTAALRHPCRCCMPAF